MRLKISHETTYRYASPANWAIQTLRLTPRGHNGLYVADWRIEIDQDCRLDAATDAFGNRVHSFTAAGPLDSLSISAFGTVETEDTNGVLDGQVERFPTELFLRETSLTKPDAAIRDLATASQNSTGKDRLAFAHQLMTAIQSRMDFQNGPTHVATTAAEAHQHGAGVCQDFAHVFIAAARHVELPARYVSGYLHQPDHLVQEAGHGWAEAYIDGLGWVGFDPANGVCPNEHYVRVAIGLDYLGAAPVRGTRLGGHEEEMTVRVEVRSPAESRA